MSTAVGLLLLTLAQTPPTWGLTWTAPDGCIRTAELAERIEQRVNRPLFGGQPGFRLEGYASPQGDGWRARLTLLDRTSTVLGTRELASAEADCRRLDERLVLIASLLIEPVVGAPTTAPPVAALPPLPVVRPLPVPRVMVLNEGRYLDGGRRIDLDTLYRLAGRSDLTAALQSLRATRVGVLVVGIVGSVVGALVLLSAAAGLDCQAYSGTPASPGRCTRLSPGLLTAGGILLGGGLLSALGSLLVRSSPTTLAEDRALADHINELRAPR